MKKAKPKPAYVPTRGDDPVDIRFAFLHWLKQNFTPTANPNQFSGHDVIIDVFANRVDIFQAWDLSKPPVIFNKNNAGEDITTPIVTLAQNYIQANILPITDEVGN